MNQVQPSFPWVPGGEEKTSAFPSSSLLIPWETEVQLGLVLQQMVLTFARSAHQVSSPVLFQTLTVSQVSFQM